MLSDPRVNIDGDSRVVTTNHYLSVSSSDRVKSEFSTSDDCAISFDEFRNVLSVELLNFEVPHTKYAIDENNSTLYISEKISDTEFNFFGLKVGTSGYLVSNLVVSLELSQKCPIKYSSDDSLHNSYVFVTSSPTGKVAITSSGDVPFSVHNCQETLSVVALTKSSARTATLQYLAPFENIVAPGAVLLLRLSGNPEMDIQVIANDAPRMVTVIGDFSNVDNSNFDVNMATMTPLSAENSISEILGLGLVDLQPGVNDSVEVIGVESPFSGAMGADTSYVTPMLSVRFPAFVSTGDYVRLSGVDEYMSRSGARVATTHDESHFEIEYDPSTAFEGVGVEVVTSSGNTWPVDSIVVSGTGDGEAAVVVSLTESASSVSAGDSLTITGLTGDHWSSAPEMLVSSVQSATEIVGVIFVPCVATLAGSNITATPVNSITGNSTTYVGPYRYDLSACRRTIFCRMVVDDLDVGSITIPGSRTKFFGRIQLFSGGDLVNFSGTNNAWGDHTFNSLVKRLRRIHLRFYNDDGTLYKFEGCNYSMFLKVVCLSSNTGI